MRNAMSDRCKYIDYLMLKDLCNYSGITGGFITVRLN